jgi:hypothetical protein
MELKIEKNSLIKDIQKEFNASYPYLKIEFFKYFNPVNKYAAKAEKISPDEPVNKLIKFYKSGRINIDDKRTGAELELDFWETIGLSAKLFRKSENMWIETTLTGNWALSKQNEEGELLSKPITVKGSGYTDLEDKWMELE